VIAVGNEDDGDKAGNGNGVAGMKNAARLALDGFQIGGEVVTGNLRVFFVGAVVKELVDRDSLDQLGQAADMVVVVVSGEQVVDALDAGVAHGCLNAPCVAAIRGGPACIDEQGLACRTDEQCGLATFHVDGVDEEVVRPGRGLRMCGVRFGGMRWSGKLLRGHEERKSANGKKQGAHEARLEQAADDNGAGFGGDSHLRISVNGWSVVGNGMRGKTIQTAVNRQRQHGSSTLPAAISKSSLTPAQESSRRAKRGTLAAAIAIPNAIAAANSHATTLKGSGAMAIPRTATWR